MPKISSVEALKGLAIIGVVLSHMVFENRFSEHVIQFIMQANIILGWCVFAFFWISGFLFFWRKIEANNIYSVIRERFSRLVKTMLVFSLMYKLMIYCSIFLGMSKNDLPKVDGLYDLLILMFFPVGPQFYFLIYLFLVTLLFILLRSIISTVHFIWFVSVGFLILCTVSESPISPHGPSVELIPFYCLCFSLGFLANVVENEKSTLWLYLILLSVIVLGSIFKSTIFLYVLVPPMLYIFFGKFYSNVVVRMLSLLGGQSSAIFVWHTPIVLPALSLISFSFISISWLGFCFVFFLCFAVCFMASNIVNRVECLRLFRF